MSSDVYNHRPLTSRQKVYVKKKATDARWKAVLKKAAKKQSFVGEDAVVEPGRTNPKLPKGASGSRAQGPPPQKTVSLKSTKKKRAAYRNTTCHKCQNPGHFASDCCNKLQKNVCFNCLQTGHFAIDCPQLQQQSLPNLQQQSLPDPQQQSLPDPQQQSLPDSQQQSPPDSQQQSLPDPQQQSLPDPQQQSLPNPQQLSLPDPQHQSPPNPQQHSLTEYRRQPTLQPAYPMPHAGMTATMAHFTWQNPGPMLVAPSSYMYPTGQIFSGVGIPYACMPVAPAIMPLPVIMYPANPWLHRGQYGPSPVSSVPYVGYR